MKIKKWQIGLIVLVLLVVVFMGKRDKSVEVKEVPFSNKLVKRTVSASGVVKSISEANLSFAAIGRLAQMQVKEGDVVQKNAYLAMLDNYAESQTSQAYRDARDIAKRDKELFIETYESNPSATGGMDEYNIQLRRYDELLSKAEATYQAQLGTVGRMYLYAPFAGKIIDVFNEVGETVGAGVTLVKMADTDNLVFEIELDQEDFGYLKLDQEVEIVLDAYENETFKGKVTSLPTYVDSATGTDFVINIEFSGDNSEKVLLGMTGDAYIILASTDNAVPAVTFDEVIYDLDDNPFVYVVEGENAKKLPVELGLQGDIYTEIKTNIETPIITGVDDKNVIEDGAKIKLEKEKN